MISGAKFSDNKKYRYKLWRIWDTKKPPITWILLNPSTADEVKNDPTIRRCINFSKRWEFGGIIILNLFALRSTDPDNLKIDLDPVGPENDAIIISACWATTTIVAAWGNHGVLLDRGLEVKEIIEESTHIPIKVLNLTKTDQPAHPLYLKKNLTLKNWNEFKRS